MSSTNQTVLSESERIEDNHISTDEVRSRLEKVVIEAVAAADSCVIKAPTGSGKTHFASTTGWRSRSEITGGEPVVVFSGTKAARRDAEQKSDGARVEWSNLLGRDDACSLVKGDHDSGAERVAAPDGGNPSDWFRKIANQNGIPISVAHGAFVSRVDDPIVDNHECQLESQWTDVLRDHETGEVTNDVVHVTHQFAHAPELLKSANVIIDELPDFSLSLDYSRVRDIVTSYLNQSSLEISDYEEFVVNHVRKESQYSAEDIRLPDVKWFFSDKGHALGPAIVEAMLTSEERQHRRLFGEVDYEFPDLFHGGARGNSSLVRIVIDDDNNVQIVQSLPDFSKARSVIGLDAYPTPTKWKANVGYDLSFKPILSDIEARDWRRYERRLSIKQVGNQKCPWTTGGLNEDKLTLLCKELSHKFPDKFRSAITTKHCEDKMRGILEQHTDCSPTTLHHGYVKSREELANEDVGLVAGCTSPSTDQVKNWLALVGESAEPRRSTDENYTGQEWHGTGRKVAHQFIADVREKGTLQAAGRYARSPADPEDGATVYVMTNVLSENKLPVMTGEHVDKILDGPSTFGEKGQMVVDCLYESSEMMSASEVVEKVDVNVTKKHVRNVMNRVNQAEWADVTEAEPASQTPERCSLERNPNGTVEL